MKQWFGSMPTTVADLIGALSNLPADAAVEVDEYNDTIKIDIYVPDTDEE